MQPANKVTIKNKGCESIVDEVAEAFARHAIYSIRALYSRYDQLHLANESKDLTTVKISLRLVRMCILTQGARNSMPYMQNAMRTAFEGIL